MNERARRLWAGAEAGAMGYGGVSAVGLANGGPTTMLARMGLHRRGSSWSAGIMTESWAPEPPRPPEKRSAARRVVFTWLGLIALFVIIYSLFDRSGNPKYSEGSVEAVPSIVWTIISHGLCLALPTALIVWLVGGSQRFNTQQREALEALGDGQYARAAELFGALAHRFRAKPNLGPVAAYNQAYAQIRAGDADRAVGVLLGAERWPNLHVNGVRALVALELARAFAVGGDVDNAQRWLDAARARNTDNGDPGQTYAELAAVTGLVLCRAGKLDDAIRHFDETWERMQSRLTVREMCAVWLLRAFAIGNKAAPRDAAASETWLQLVRSTRPYSLAWLTEHWPELASFVATHVTSALPREAIPARS